MGKVLVSIFIPSLAMGGAEKVVVQLANGLASLGWRVQLLMLSKEGELIESLSPQVEIVELRCTTYRQAVPALARYFERFRPSIVLTSLYATGLATIAAKLISRHKPKVIVGAHNSFRSKIMRPDNAKDKYLLKPLCRLLFPWADAYIAVSRGVADELQSVLKLRKEKIRIIYNPVVNEELIARARESVTHPWLVDPAGREFKTLISVGRLVEQKGYDALLKAFAQVKNILDCRLIIVGSGPLQSTLERLAVSLGVGPFVDFLGLQRNPQKFVSRADLFVLSSRWEGLANVLIEALACGCPVVATDCEFGPKEILDGGKYGMLAPVDDPAELATVIVRALKSDGRAQESALRIRALDFSVHRSVEQYERMFTEINPSVSLPADQ